MAYHEIDVTKVGDREYLKHAAGVSTALAAESWANYRRIGEVRYAIARGARIAGYTKFRGVRTNHAGEIIEEADKGVVADIVAEITSRFGGTRGLMERYYTLRKIPADSYMIAVRPDPTVEGPDGIDGYWFMSPSEVGKDLTTPDVAAGRNDPITWVTSSRTGSSSSKSEFRRQVQPGDFYGRVWTPDGEYLDDPNSPMQALNEMCEMLNLLTQSIKGRLLQRFTLAGILLIPSEINDSAITGVQPKAGLYSNDKVLNYFVHVMTQNVIAHNTGLSQVPIMLKGPADVLDKVRHLIFDSMVAETDLKLRGELINRILDGLDQIKGAVSGDSQSSSSRFAAWQVSDEERRITVTPDIEIACHAFTRMVLYRRLLARKWDHTKIKRWHVWYDLSASAVKSNMAEDARQAHDRAGVNAAFLRQMTGATEDDKMDSAEYARWVGVKIHDPYLALYGLTDIEVDWDKVSGGAITGPSADRQGDPAEAGPGVKDDGSPGARDDDVPTSETPG